jgi:hypothetical protein
VKRKTLTLIIAILAAFTLTAQEKKETKKASKSAILHPELTVENEEHSIGGARPQKVRRVGKAWGGHCR